MLVIGQMSLVLRVSRRVLFANVISLCISSLCFSDNERHDHNFYFEYLKIADDGRESPFTDTGKMFSTKFSWMRSDGSRESLNSIATNEWASNNSQIRVVSNTLEQGLLIYNIYVDSKEIEGKLAVSSHVSLQGPLVYSRYAEYDFLKERTRLGSLVDSVKWLPEGKTITPYTPVLSVENLQCGLELIFPSNHHEPGTSDFRGISISHNQSDVNFDWYIDLEGSDYSDNVINRFQFGMFSFCDSDSSEKKSNVVIYPIAAYPRVQSWLSDLTPNIDIMAFFTWKRFPVEQIGLPVVNLESTRIKSFSEQIKTLVNNRVKPIFYGALHGLSSLDPKLRDNSENWASDDSRRSGWTQFNKTKLQPVTLESASLQAHYIDKIELAWSQGFTESAYLDLGMPTRTKYTTARAFENSSKTKGLKFTPLFHQWAFLKELSERKRAINTEGRIILHSGMIVPRFLAQHVDNVLVGEPLWREFSKDGKENYKPDYNKLPETLVRYYWGKRNFGEPILLPILTNRYKTKLRKKSDRNVSKKRNERLLLKSETEDLVRFLLASELQLWTSGTDIEVVRDYLLGIDWLGGSFGTDYCVIPLNGPRKQEALGIRTRGGKSIAYHLKKNLHIEGKQQCVDITQKMRELVGSVSNSEKSVTRIYQVE